MSGQMVARTGRYKWMTFGALLVMALGLFLLSTMTRDTPVPLLWGYMLITGLGVGPTFAVFTLIVQNSVAVAQLGTATANLTFFQQVGGTVGLAITGSIFSSSLRDQVPTQLLTAELPSEVTTAMASGGLDPNLFTSVGDLGGKILGSLPTDLRALFEPHIGGIVEAIYRAFSIATANTFTLGIVTALVAAGLVSLLKERKLELVEGAPTMMG